MGYIAFVYAIIFAQGKHSCFLLAYGNSKPPLSGNQGNFEIDGGRSRGRVSQFVDLIGSMHFALCKSLPFIQRFLFQRRLLRLVTEYIDLVILFEQNGIWVGVTVFFFLFCKLTTVTANNFLSLYVGSENWPLTYFKKVIQIYILRI